jgi:hypothetical protein
MTFAKGFLVHPDVLHRSDRLPTLPADDRTLHDAPGLVPADRRDRARAFDRAALQDEVDNQPLHQQGEATASLRPRHPNLLDAMRGTLDARNLGMETGLKLAGVEMAPRPLLGVIKRGQLDAALGARPPRWIVLQPEVDALVVGLQFHTRDVPWRGDPQNRFEQIRVLQPLLPEPLYQPDTSTINPPPSRPPTQVQGPRRRPHKSPGSLATHEDSGRAVLFFMRLTRCCARSLPRHSHERSQL